MLMRQSSIANKLKSYFSELQSEYGGISGFIIAGISLLILTKLISLFKPPLHLFSKEDLERLALFGDALNPYISLASAILVATGLFYTVRDFKLARLEFRESAEALKHANKIEESKISLTAKRNQAEIVKSNMLRRWKDFEKYHFHHDLVFTVLIENPDDYGEWLIYPNSFVKVDTLYGLLNLAKTETTHGLIRADGIMCVLNGLEITDETEKHILQKQVKFALNHNMTPHVIEIFATLLSNLRTMQRYKALADPLDFDYTYSDLIGTIHSLHLILDLNAFEKGDSASKAIHDDRPPKIQTIEVEINRQARGTLSNIEEILESLR